MTVQKGPGKYSKYSFLVIVLISALVLSYAVKTPLVQSEKKIIYSEFLQLVEEKKIKEVKIVNHGSRVHGTLTDGTSFTSDAPEDKDLVKALRDAGITFSAENPGMKENLTSFITVILVPAAVILVFWLLIMRQAQGSGAQAMSFGRSKAKLLTDNRPKITFDDVAGVNEAKEELKEIVEFLMDPKKFQTLGAKIPKGVLLVGAPGTGKTLLARAISGEAGVPFLHMSGSDFVEMFVGVGASRVRDLFDQAKKNAPCLVFIDEIDAVGRQRGAGLGGGHDEREQTLNQLLVEMDGFDANIGVIMIAATNRPDVLDPALLRPGRFDRRVIVDRPDINGRKEILLVHSKDKPLDISVDLDVVAKRTPGFTGADLENVLNEAAILAARQEKKSIEMPHIEEAIDRVMAGPERKSMLLTEREKKYTAFHEAGHALVAKLIPECDPVHKISILPRGLALGYTLQLPQEDKHSKMKSELVNDICVLLGGRAAEQIMIGETSTGASNDLERATKIARRMVCEYGMSDELGPLAFGRKEDAVFLGRDLGHERDYGEEVASKIDKAVRKIIDDCDAKAYGLLETHKDRLQLVTDKLIEHETLEGIRLEHLLEGNNISESELSNLEEIKRKEQEEERKKKLEELAKKSGNGENEENTPEPAGFLYEKFLTILKEKLSSGYGDSHGESIEQAFEKIDKALANENTDGFEKIISEIKPTVIPPDEAAYFHHRMATVLAEKNLPSAAYSELLAVLQTSHDDLDGITRRVVVSSVSYFRILLDELKKSKKDFDEFLNDDELMRKVDAKYAEWEEKSSSSPGSFHKMT